MKGWGTLLALAALWAGWVGSVCASPGVVRSGWGVEKPERGVDERTWRDQAAACEAIFALAEFEADAESGREVLEEALDCAVNLNFTCAHYVSYEAKQGACYEKSWSLKERYFVQLQSYPGWERPNWVLANECLAIVDELADVRFLRKNNSDPERWGVVRRLEACKNKLVLPCNYGSHGRTKVPGFDFDACMRPVLKVEERNIFVADVSSNPMACFLVHGWRGGFLCPEFHYVEGYRVWLSPFLLDDPGFTEAAKQGILDVLRARLVVIDEIVSSQVGVGWGDKLRYWKSWFWERDAYLYPDPWHGEGFRSEGLEFFIESWEDREESTWDPCFLSGGASACADNRGTQVGLYVSRHVGAEGGVEFRITTGTDTLLHEMAHSWHGAVVAGRSVNSCIENAYERNKSRYRDVESFWGGIVDRGSFGRVSNPYLTTNEAEYFAELSVLYFLGESYYPYHKAELFRHDPEGYRVVVGAWQAPETFCPGETPTSLLSLPMEDIPLGIE